MTSGIGPGGRMYKAAEDEASGLLPIPGGLPGLPLAPSKKAIGLPLLQPNGDAVRARGGTPCLAKAILTCASSVALGAFGDAVS